MITPGSERVKKLCIHMEITIRHSLGIGEFSCYYADFSG